MVKIVLNTSIELFIWVEKELRVQAICSHWKLSKIQGQHFMALGLCAISGVRLIWRSRFLAEWFCLASLVPQKLCSSSLTQLSRKEKVAGVLKYFPLLEFSYCMKQAIGSSSYQPPVQLQKM